MVGKRTGCLGIGSLKESNNRKKYLSVWTVPWKAVVGYSLSVARGEDSRFVGQNLGGESQSVCNMHEGLRSM